MRIPAEGLPGMTRPVPGAKAKGRLAPPTPETGAVDADGTAAGEEVELVVGYTFTWRPRRQPKGRRRPESPNEGSRSPDADRGRKHPRKSRKAGPRRHDARKVEAKPARREDKERPVDPDNPFNVLMKLKDKL